MFLTKDSSSPYYQVVYFINGKRTKRSTKTANKKMAEKFLQRFQPQSAFIPQLHQVSSITLSDFKDEYVEYLGNNKSKHYIRSAILSFRHLSRFTGELPINQIIPKIIDQFISTVYNCSPYAAKLYYSTLKAAFTKAVLWNYIDDNPFKKVKAPKLVKSFPSFITTEELNLIIQNEKNDQLRNIYLTAFYTGMRLGEILNMKWNWIDFQKNTIIVKCTEDFSTKSKKERIVPINPILKSTLQNISPVIINLYQSSFVFQKVAGVKFNEDFISKRFKKAIRAAKINDNIHFHSLRHSFASNLAQKGVSLYVVKELLGHEDIKTTQIYSHLQKENLALAVNLL